MGRPISPHFWVGPGLKKLTQKYTWVFLAQAHLAHTKMGPAGANPSGFGPVHYYYLIWFLLSK